jgi:RNA polymerase sigma factor (TIGR02999 family)
LNCLPGEVEPTSPDHTGSRTDHRARRGRPEEFCAGWIAPNDSLTSICRNVTIPHLRDCWGECVASSSSQSVTELLARWKTGDVSARDALVPLVYDELRRIARRCLSNQPSNHTLQPTALVHEAYLRLARRDSVDWQDRGHFFALAAQMMRQILVDHARKQLAVKRGGNAITVVVDESSAVSKETSLDLLALDDAMNRLATLDPRQCQIVELRFFGGLSIEETAEAVKISTATTKREWATARLWLYNAMSSGTCR